MAVFFYVLFVWAFITALGHGTWLAIRAIGRQLSGSFDSLASNPEALGDRGTPERRSLSGNAADEAPSPVKDIAAFERMVDALAATDGIEAATASELKAKAREFAGMAEASRSAEVAGLAEVASPDVSIVGPVRREDRVEEVARDHTIRSAPVAAERRTSEASPQPVLGQLSHADVGDRSSAEEPFGLAATRERAQPASVQPASVQRAMSEVITSFLADHNIRWGELVAGLMIVVCSIGLVVSLWSTITSTHRVVPSLIFMSADAAIFAAGLYTMRRWKLRHTSRAVLIIATLLVPLSVLAGLAAAGASVDTVSLSSPTTLAAIALGTVGCGWLLWMASLELVGRGGAAALTASVVAPTLCLPLLPAVGRWLGVGAGSFLFVPAIATAAALLVPSRRHFRSTSPQTRRLLNDGGMKGGRRFWSNHWLRLGIAIAALASVVVYAAFLYKADGRIAWIQIAIATVPVWVSILTMHVGFSKMLLGVPKRATSRFVCVVLSVIAAGVVLLALPASIERVAWLWAHAAAISGAMIGAGLVLRGRPRLAEASVPVGIAAMLSSPSWLARSDWGDVAVWRAFLGGEPMMVSLGFAMLSGMVGAFLYRRQVGASTSKAISIADSDATTWFIATAFWGVIASVQAVVLSVAPTSWLGMMPVWALAGILFGAMVLAAWVAVRDAARASAWIWASAVAGTCFWLTCFGVVRWADGGLFVEYESIATALIGLSSSMLVLAIAGKLTRPDRSRVAVARLVGMSVASACGVVGFLAVQGWMGARLDTVLSPSWGVSAWETVTAGALLAIGAFVVSQRRYLQIAMMVSAIAVFCGVTHFGGIELWQISAWKNTDALWSGAAVLVVAATVWTVVRECFRFLPARYDNPLVMNTAWSRRVMPDGGFLIASLGVLGVGVAWRYVAVLCGPLGAPLDQWFNVPSGLDVRSLGRLSLMMGLAGGLWVSQLREPCQMFRRSLGVVGGLSGLLFAIGVSASIAASPSLQLIGTTTLACGGVLAAWGIGSRVRPADGRSHGFDVGDFGFSDSESGSREIGVVTLGVLLSLGSAVLLWADWWGPLSEGLAPDRWSTLAVASWWVASSLGLLFFSSRFDPLGEFSWGRLSVANPVESDGVAREGAIATDLRRVLSAMLMPAAIGIGIPVFFVVPEVIWWQASVIGAVLWLAIATVWSPANSQKDGESTSDQGAALSWVWILLVGLVSAGVVLGGLLSDASPLITWSLPLGAIVSVLALMVCCRTTSLSSASCRVDWDAVARVLPFWLPVMSGHLACIAIAMGWIDASDSLLVIVGSGLIGSIASAVLVWRRASPIQAWHVTGQTLLLFGLAFLCWRGWFSLSAGREAWVLWMALAAMGTAAVALMRFVRYEDLSKGGRSVAILPRILGWFVVLAGSFLLLIHPEIDSRGLVRMTCVVGWVGACVVLWRSDRLAVLGHRQVARADVGVSALLVPMLMFSVFMLDADVRWRTITSASLPAAMGMLQFLIACVVAATCLLRPGVPRSRPLSMWSISLLLVTLGAAVGAASFARVWQLESGPRWVAIIMAATVSVTMVIGGLASIERLRSRLELRIGRGPEVDRFGIAAEWVVLGWVCFGSLISIGLAATAGMAGSIGSGTDANWVRLSIVAIAGMAWSLFMLSEQTQPIRSGAADRRRNLSVMVGLWALVLVAVLGQPDAGEWLLTATMRLLIASVFAIGVIALAVPRLLGGPFLDRWQNAFRLGSRCSAIVAGVSLLSMLGIEMAIRQGNVGIPGVAMPLVVVVAIILGGFALMTGMLAILSGPTPERSLIGEAGPANWLRLDDSRRRQLLYAAQAIAGLTWLHLFLCRSSIAFLGLRQVWPYVVMVIAFASVGLTQWAIRRGDAVLSETMRRTAMFLPMIPVVGFWLSGSYASIWHSDAWSWTFYNGTASYQGLLVVGAIYYGVMSVMWKQGMPRVATVVLANGALWVMLTQMPGWDFLTHPQAWLIPPAVCVLAVAYWQRESLDATVGAAIRYGATLVIYLSSTADMLMSEIGSSLWGPVILVSLSLAGMLVGVALRVKPFLYLGAIFVFMGVTSMVWHATESIDAVWPWWVFGITTGLLLLSALAGIEKHRGRLQQWSAELAKWQN
ncbi:hypothetical protein [Rhodopirellula sp. SWK7]|uniref:hypothetical protein n=1 Tax=Rhodopirellula sp. SWK7 TaxID=595460 RepID=UPI0002BE02FF|nr:hypothetical protein [Rhodopirellula sp. SWK7]EMI45740.1 putative membrane protein [Rhodopirellula sp. SWK7]